MYVRNRETNKTSKNQTKHLKVIMLLVSLAYMVHVDQYCTCRAQLYKCGIDPRLSKFLMSTTLYTQLDIVGYSTIVQTCSTVEYNTTDTIFYDYVVLLSYIHIPQKTFVKTTSNRNALHVKFVGLRIDTQILKY